MKQSKERFAIKKIKQLIPLSSKNSFNNVSHHFYHLKRQLNEQKYLYSSIGATEMSIGHSNVHSSNGRTEMSIGHSNVHSSNGRMDMVGC